MSEATTPGGGGPADGPLLTVKDLRVEFPRQRTYADRLARRPVRKITAMSCSMMARSSSAAPGSAGGISASVQGTHWRAAMLVTGSP